jgi:hypothetical protein
MGKIVLVRRPSSSSSIQGYFSRTKDEGRRTRTRTKNGTRILLNLRGLFPKLTCHADK